MRSVSPVIPVMPMPSWDDFRSLPVGEGSLLEEYLVLYSLSALLKPRSMLEVGTSTGVASLMFLWGASLFDSTTRLTTIDIARSPVMQANFAKYPRLRERITFIQGDSLEVLGRLAGEGARFDLIFLDGSHEFDHIRGEWRITEHMSDTWIIHDTQQFPGPGRVVQEIVQGGAHEVWSLRYPMGHQVHDVVAEGRTFRGLYHQRSFPWTKGEEGPGMTFIRRRGAP